MRADAGFHLKEVSGFSGHKPFVPRGRGLIVLREARLHHCGIGFVWMWVYAMFETPAFYPHREGVGINADPSWLASAASVALALFAFGLWFSRRRPSHERAIGWIGSVLIVLGTLLSAVSIGEGAAGFMDACAGTMSGVGTALLMLVWCSALSRLTIGQAELGICLSTALPLVGALVFPYLDGAVGMAAVSSLPVISAALLSMTIEDASVHEGASSSDDGADAHLSIAGFLRAMMVVAVVYAITGCLGVFQDVKGDALLVWGIDAPTILGTGLGIVLVFSFVQFSHATDFTELFRWLAPLLTVALAFFPWDGRAMPIASSTILSMADTAMQAISLLCLVAIVKRRIANAYGAAGLCLGSIQLGVLVGNVAGARAIDSVRMLPDGMFALAFVLMCVLACSQVLLARTESQPSGSSSASARVRFPAFGTARGIVGEDEFRTAVSRSRARAFLDEEGQSSAGCSEQGRALRDEDASLTHEEEIDVRCAQLADEFGLSLREQEVLGYLGRGRSQPYIRDQLVLSKNTVASHVKHIYAKLGVHSKQEVIDLFE